METLRRDLWYACRSLMAQPGWTLAAIVCLAVGTGPNTAAFSIVNGLLLRPLPFPESQQLVMVAIQEPDRPQTRPFSLSEYGELAPQLGPLVELSIRTFAPVALASDDESRMVQAEVVSHNYFDMLRLTPIAGRFYRRESESARGPAEGVISYALWRHRFNGDPAIVGRVLRVNSHPITICGVAPPGFVGVMSIVAADLWIPSAMGRTVAGIDEATPQFGAVGRLKPGTSRAQLRARLDVVLAAHQRSSTRPSTGVVVEASGFGVPPAVRPAVIGASALLFGLLALVTGVAIANVASLTLARAMDRRREMAVRRALGAGTSRIVSQMLSESLVLAAAGGAVGLLLAIWVTRGLAALMPSSGQPAHIAFAIDLTPDLRVFAYAVVGSILVAALFGLAPARYASRADVVDALKASAGSGRRPATVRALMAIVVGQIAVSTTLLVGAGLLVRTYLNTLAVEPGIETRHLLTVSLDLDQLGTDAVAGRRLYDDVLRRVSALPDVEMVSLTRERPLTFSGRDVQVWIDDRSGAGGSADANLKPSEAGAIVVSPGYFDMLGVRLVQGRAFTTADRGRPAVAIVNETMARRFWPDGSALGRTVRVRQHDGDPILVVGVARDLKYRSLTEPPRPVFYQPFAQEYSPRMSLLIRWRTDRAAVANAVEHEIRSANRDLAIVDIATLDDQVERALAPRRQSAILLLAVCALALLLSSVGLYGVIAYGVRRRAREFGIRIALGARARDVMLMVVAQGFRLTLAGLILGVGISLAVTRLIANMLFGVGTHDVMTLGITGLVIGVVTLAAVYLPALWATRVDPIVALREE
jgi:putative ABC transport system permease protein